MKRNQNYFIIKNQADFITYSQSSPYFISPIYDTGQKGVVWHRMKIACNMTNPSIRVSIYSSDSLFIEENGRDIPLHEILYDKEKSLEQIMGNLQMCLKKEQVRQKDMLLHEVKGRYGWFIIEFLPEEGKKIEISEIKLYFPKETWLEFLPEYYQHDSKSAAFLESFLGIFQSLYEDLNEDIKHSFVHFQPDVCNQEYLTELAKWIHMEKAYIWKEDKLRYILSNSMKFYEYRGTIRSLLEMVQLFTGERAYIVEQHKLLEDRAGKRKALMDSLYGTNPYSFSLIVKEEHISSEKELKTLADIVDDTIPAQMECNIVVARPYLFLDHHTYLGLNSVLNKYKPFDFKNQAMVNFVYLDKCE